MTVFFSDTFSGAAGPLSGHVPDTPFGSVVWSSFAAANSGGIRLDGAGAAVGDGNAEPLSATSNAFARYNFAQYQSNPTLQKVELSFQLTFGPSLTMAGSGIMRGLMLVLTCNGMTSTANIFGETTGGSTTWFIGLGAAANRIAISSLITAGGTYSGALAVENGLQTFTFAGVSRTTSDAWGDGEGIRLLEMYLGGFNSLESLTGSSGPPPVTGWVSAQTPLGSPLVIDAAYVPGPSYTAWAACGSMLGSVNALALHDYSALVDGLESRYVVDFVTPTGKVRVPISSWQATLQTLSSNYVQCVVPACLPWVDTLNEATEFVVYRQALLPIGMVYESEMARAPAETVQFDRGPERYTCTVSGYSAAFVGNANPLAAFDRVLRGVRSISSGSSMRVRCAIDWMLRPGMRALVDGVPIVVGYINYYAPSSFDSYMDVGEQT